MTGTEAQLPAWLADTPPVLQAAGVLLFTFVSEDAAAVGSALLHSTGSLSWTAAFAAAMLGIWLGDAGLYWLARGVGRPLLQHRWAQRWFDAAKIARAEHWFAERGVWVLLSSRIVPGTRLPTYLAAGFLKMPFSRFLAVTGVAVLAWTLMVFALIGWFGADLLLLLERWRFGGLAVIGSVIAGVLLLRLGLRAFDRGARRRAAAALERWTRWEFWPAWIFYPPVILWCGWLMVRHRGIRLPGLANPGIFSGGIVGESKLATLRELSERFPAFTAAAVEVPEGLLEERLTVLRAAFPYPFILKPDMGQRGLGVKLIRDEAQAREYLRQTGAPLVAQAYAPGRIEAGVFYYRFPHEARGRIFAITDKVFPRVTGDGVNTVEDLIWRDPRARLIAGKISGPPGRPRAFGVARASTNAAGRGGQSRPGLHLRGWRTSVVGGIGGATRRDFTRVDRIFHRPLRYTLHHRGRTAGRAWVSDYRTQRRRSRGNEHPRRAQLPVERLPHFVPAMVARVRHRFCQPTARGAVACTLGEIWTRYREFLRHSATYPLAD
ncbi:MAG: hypothetical protein HC814_00105 [Rhodobacteraceae bacterium]|nr:hypothetical protein [Paracoccaceae bacterium]